MTQNQKIQGKFFPFTQETYQKLKEAKLTAAEWRLWAYLVTLFPFGDRYEDLPDTLTILEECEISKSTFWIAIAKLQDFELFDFQDKGFSARNLAYPSVEIEQNKANLAESEKSDSRPKNRTVNRQNPYRTRTAIALRLFRKFRSLRSRREREKFFLIRILRLAKKSKQ
jgi:hypothetical protein